MHSSHSPLGLHVRSALPYFDLAFEVFGVGLVLVDVDVDVDVDVARFRGWKIDMYMYMYLYLFGTVAARAA